MHPELWDPRAVQRALRGWYRRHHRRLPWRETSDPYAIWVSEIMLQQTRVEAVLGYYTPFLDRFPDVRSLAAAREDDVLAAWSGLGYYRRARNLRLAAQALVREHAGQFPREMDSALSLPGVGRSTAGAILSIAFDQPRPVLDGNVARVLRRLHARPDAPSASPAEMWRRAEELVPERGGAGQHSQAMMELGAMICLPRNPRCSQCPAARWCGARAWGLADGALDPAARAPRRATVAEEEHAALIVRRGSVIVLERRLERKALHGMVGLPLAESREALERKLGAGVVFRAEELASVTHAIMHRRIRTRLWPARLPARARLEAPLFEIAAAAVFDQPLDGTSRKILKRHLRTGHLLAGSLLTRDDE